MENSNYDPNAPGHPEEYGWKEESAAREPGRGLGKRILLGVAGVLLIVSGLMGVARFVFPPFHAMSEVAHEVATQVAISAAEYEYEAVAPVQDTAAAYVEMTVVPKPPVPPRAEMSVTPVETVTWNDDDGVRVMESRVDLVHAGINTISLSAAAANVEIFSSDEEELTLRMEMYGDTNYTVGTDDDILMIHRRQDVATRRGKASDQISIGVPSSYTGGLSIQFAAGTVDISGLTGSELEIDAAAGNFSLQELSYEAIFVKMSAGSISGNDITSEWLTVESEAGEVNLSGDLGVTTSNSTAGSVALEYNTMPSAIEVTASMGSTDIYLPDDAVFSLYSSMVMGDFHSDFQTSPPNVNSENRVSVIATMGDVSIHKN